MLSATGNALFHLIVMTSPFSVTTHSTASRLKLASTDGAQFQLASASPSGSSRRSGARVSDTLSASSLLDCAVVSADEVDKYLRGVDEPKRSTLQALRRHEEAIACYRTVLVTNPGYARAHNNLGTQLDALNRYEEAIACYHNALSIKPVRHSQCLIGAGLGSENNSFVRSATDRQSASAASWSPPDCSL